MCKKFFPWKNIGYNFCKWVKKMIEGFGPKVPGFDHFVFGDHKSLKKSLKIQLQLWLRI